MGCSNKYAPRFISLVALAVIAPLAIYDLPKYFVLFYAPSIIAYYGTVWITFKHHSGLRTKNEFEASYNVLDDFYNKASFNLGYHTAHHMRFGIHWSRLPKFHAKIRHEIPKDCLMKPMVVFQLMDKLDAWIVRLFGLRQV